MGKINWNGVIDNLQAFLVWFVIAVTGICTMTLILFDIVVPATGSMMYLTNGNEAVAAGISFATTGLLMALMFIGYSLFEKQEWRGVGVAVLVVAFLVYIADIVFDSLSADVFRYGRILAASEIQSPVSIHWMFRGLIGGISTVGEALAIAIIAGMPVLKTFINSALPESRRFQPSGGRPEPRSAESIHQPKPQYQQTSAKFQNIPRSGGAAPKHSGVPAGFRPAPKPIQDSDRPEPTYHHFEA
jgi:hypothetical protein